MPDGSATITLLQRLSEPHLYMVVMLGMLLGTAYAFYRSWIDRRALHSEIDELRGRLEECERLWREFHFREGG